MYSFVGYIYISGSGSITSVGEERANLSAIVCLLIIMWFLLERFSLPLGAWDGLRYFIVALHLANQSFISSRASMGGGRKFIMVQVA